MTVLDPWQASTLLWQDGDAAKTALYALKGASEGDTIDFGPSGSGHFNALTRAVVVGSDIGTTAGIEGTIVTVPHGMTNDSKYYLFAMGDSI
jgi:hypothetical protein